MTCTIVSNQKECSWECKNENELIYTAAKLKIIETLQKMHHMGYTDYYVNCEYGIPLWTAEAICAFKLYQNISLHLVIPYEEQCRNWHREHIERYYAVHEKADSVTFASIQYNHMCYETADMQMIDKSDAVLLFASPDDRLFAMGYAKSVHKKILYVTDLE